MKDAILIIGTSLLAVPVLFAFAVGCIVTFALLRDDWETWRRERRHKAKARRPSPTGDT
jgi:hypothetical protein